jgi:membrane associated rhomboid family serine protease/DNA-directed RNA polymerase subunit M/transcription elongation factor TFIIS
MYCPTCREPLERRDSNSEQYQTCPRCGGLLAKGPTIARIAKNKAKNLTPKKATILSPVEAKNIYTLDETTIPCPKCSSPMKKINYMYDSNVFADKCPSCNLIWLEKDEMELLAQHFTRNPLHQKMGQAMATMERERTKPVTKRDPRARVTVVPIPLGDHVKRVNFPYINILLIIINLAVSLAVFFSHGGILTLINSWGVSVNNVFSWALLGALFLHGDIFHLLGNMLFLWIFGDNLEDSLGHWKYLAFYLLMGAATNLTYVVIKQNNIPLIGASGAISAVMGGYLVLFAKEKIKVFFYNTTYLISAKTYIFLYLAQQILGLLAQDNASPIAYLAHLVGFILGFGGTLLLAKENLLNKVEHFYET